MMDRGTIQAMKDANDRAEFAESKLAEALDHIENLVSSIAELERENARLEKARDHWETDCAKTCGEASIMLKALKAVDEELKSVSRAAYLRAEIWNQVKAAIEKASPAS